MTERLILSASSERACAWCGDTQFMQRKTARAVYCGASCKNHAYAARDPEGVRARFDALPRRQSAIAAERKKSREALRRDSDPDKFKAKNAEYYAAHKIELIAYQVVYRAANRERIATRNAVHYQANREQVSQQTRAYRKSHPEKSREYRDRRKATQLRAACTEHDACRTDDIRAMAAALRPHECWMCGKPVSTGMFNTREWPLEHIVPMSRGGAHCIENVAWACRSCNVWKKDWLIEELLP